MQTRALAAFTLWTCTLPVFGFVHHPTADYGYLKLQGHPVYVSPEAQADPLFNRVLEKLDADLKIIHAFLPAPALSRLALLAFWVERDNPGTPGMTYHPSGAWLSEHGYNPDKAKAIELGNLRHFLDWQNDQPLMVFHEMSHAYHDQVLGFDNPLVMWAFESAVRSHSYEKVPYVKGGTQPAYALTNEKEYFAELSEAYFGKNDFYPFIRSELQTFDPPGFQMIEKLWFGR